MRTSVESFGERRAASDRPSGRAQAGLHGSEVPNPLGAEPLSTSATMLGDSLGMHHLLDQIEMVAATDATVLILGETGVGKELVAQRIHEHSLRHKRKMVTVNCTAVPRELFESEFFGHVRGAFSGAVRDRTGKFQLADGGTLFLDEVGDLSLEMQPNCYGFWRKESLRPSVTTLPAILGFVSSRPATVTSARRFASDSSARIFITG
jgi:transcriptional regulator with AAA-type ATPase domain